MIIYALIGAFFGALVAGIVAKRDAQCGRSLESVALRFGILFTLYVLIWPWLLWQAWNDESKA